MFCRICIWPNFSFLSTRIALVSFCYSLPCVRFLLFRYPLTAVNFRLFSLHPHSAFPLFSFLRFGSAKVKTFSYFPKLIFFIFLSLVCRFSNSLFSLAGGLQRCKLFLKSENLFEVFLAFPFALSIPIPLQKPSSTNFLRTSPLPYLRAAKVVTFPSFPNYSP